LKRRAAGETLASIAKSYAVDVKHDIAAHYQIAPPNTRHPHRKDQSIAASTVTSSPGIDSIARAMANGVRDWACCQARGDTLGPGRHQYCQKEWPSERGKQAVAEVGNRGLNPR
jgi:hypothetical protein